MKHWYKRLAAAALLASPLFAAQADASVVITGTRVVYPSNEREVTVKLSNAGKLPALVQTWIDKGDPQASPENLDVPFTLTPSMFRIEPDKGQTLRLIYTQEPLAQDKESLFWLNVLEVPPKPDLKDGGNALQIAYRTRIKLFFRPQGLPGTAEEAPAKTRWEVVRDEKSNGYALKATNPTPYYVNFSEITLADGGKTLNAGSGYVAPGQSELFPITGLTSNPRAGAVVNYIGINDWGGDIAGKQPLADTANH
jgi:chaperone protein EcpD